MTLIVLVFSISKMESQVYKAIVADSATHVPLPNASIYDRHGRAIGISNRRGALPKVSKECYPITIHYLGFNEKIISAESPDTIFLSENISALPEVVVESRRHRLLHILAYVRELSTLTTYTDTVFLFREKMVDYMIPSGKEVKFKGWHTPRILTCKSYYKFTDQNGLDSVSDVSHHHFSWSDWIGLVPKVSVPPALRIAGLSTDTLWGKYSPTEMWSRVNDEISIDIDVMADTTGRKWVPNLAVFFNKNLDFERFKILYCYDNIVGDTVSVSDLKGYSFDIESIGRGHEMFRFNKLNEPFFVSTHADVYVLDKEYITIKEAKKWNKRDFDIDEIDIYEPFEAPELPSSILDIINRVNNLEKEGIRLDALPDYKMVSENQGCRNFRIGRRALLMLKQATGITLYKSNKKFNKDWNEFRRNQTHKTRRTE